MEINKTFEQNEDHIYHTSQPLFQRKILHSFSTTFETAMEVVYFSIYFKSKEVHEVMKCWHVFLHFFRRKNPRFAFVRAQTSLCCSRIFVLTRQKTNAYLFSFFFLSGALLLISALIIITSIIKSIFFPTSTQVLLLKFVTISKSYLSNHRATLFLTLKARRKEVVVACLLFLFSPKNKRRLEQYENAPCSFHSFSRYRSNIKEWLAKEQVRRLPFTFFS